MKKAFRIIVAFLLLAGWGLAAGALHVVWTGASVIIIPKDRLGLRETYSDVTHWTAEDVASHPGVCKRLVATGKAEALSAAFDASSGDDLNEQIIEAVNRGPASKPAPTIIDKAKEVAHQATRVVQH